MEIQITGLGELDRMVAFWSQWYPVRALELVTDAISEDARLRIEDDVTGPDGERWDPWSRDYALTRGPQHKLLYGEGDLAKSITNQAQGMSYVVGSELDYALAQQFGSSRTNLPARPYVGVSDEVELAVDDILPADFDARWGVQ